jgi:hypothetical protein
MDNSVTVYEMKQPNRRDILRVASAAGAAWLASHGTPAGRLSAQTPEARIDVLLNEPVGTISRNLRPFRGTSGRRDL